MPKRISLNEEKSQLFKELQETLVALQACENAEEKAELEKKLFELNATIIKRKTRQRNKLECSQEEFPEIELGPGEAIVWVRTLNGDSFSKISLPSSPDSKPKRISVGIEDIYPYNDKDVDQS